METFYQNTDCATVMTFEGYDIDSPVFISICDCAGDMDAMNLDVNDMHQVCWTSADGDGFTQCDNLMEALRAARKFRNQADNGELIEGKQ
jgi:hypothetical protein|tara:strand:+ start:2212 stop:2481 length:270 start_codon:yes stop_codon:yes gene_type:complete